MSLLNFNDNSSNLKGEKKTLRLLFGIGALIGVIALGSTLAASINLNSGNPVEFGQGVAQTVACDSDGITLVPYSTFINDEENSTFYFSSIQVSDVSSNCAGITFKLRAYMNGSNDPLYWPADPKEDSFEFGFNFEGSWNSVNSCMSLNNQVTNDSSNNKVTIDWRSCVPYAAELSGRIDRLTLESSTSFSGISVSTVSCNLNSADAIAGGSTGTDVTEAAQSLISDVSGLSLNGDPVAFGQAPTLFTNFAREDGPTLGSGMSIYSGWGVDNISNWQVCLEDLVTESYGSTDPVTNIHGFTFQVDATNSVNYFDFDWIFGSHEDSDAWDVAAVIVDGHDFSLLEDGKVIHFNNGNISTGSLQFSTDPSGINETVGVLSSWSGKITSTAVLDKTSNPPNGSGISTHRITILVANTGDDGADSGLFMSNFGN